ncbi:hypothetical protein PBCVNEJV1_219L [Paramecium bursaria Chlorella virus NE-JV-1]|nr:hypothetical protein PBCVNEJV1_219L [Paramecium bursaria Chlorella virus NE-JV-1]
MDDILTTKKDDIFNIIRIISDPGQKLKRPKTTIKKQDAFQRRFVQSGNTVYVANLCTFNALTETGMSTIDLAEHVNGAITGIKYNGANFVAPSLSPIGGMNTSAVFDLYENQKAFQKKLTERGCEDVLIKDEISDVAVDDKTLLVTTKLMSANTPSERKNGIMNLNDAFVSDIVHTKRISNLSPGIVDYKVRLNIPGNYTWGVVEVLSATFFNDLLIQLIKRRDGWEIMKNASYGNCGFVIARDPETAMGVMLVDWPRGAVLFPPRVHYKEFEDVNQWSITQQIGSPLNDSVKIPGGEYSWTIRLLFGPIWFCQQQINGTKTRSHGKDHEILYGDDIMKSTIQNKYKQTKHKHAYPYF